MGEQRVVVVGGANVDIIGYPDAELVSRDSNPGRVRLSAGGVGRNIAENLARLGAQVELITALGSDPNATFLVEECARDGIGLTHALRLEAPGSLYVAILDDGGDMALALNDMRALDMLTPAVLGERQAAFEGADLVVAEANLPAESIAWLSHNLNAPLVLDAVSVAKAPRCAFAFGHLAALTCNAAEAGALLGREIDPDESGALPGAARALREGGAERVFVTAAARGVVFEGPDACGSLQAPSVRVVNATGAGDAFAAGVAYALLAGGDTASAARCGTVLASLALASARTVSEEVGPDALVACMGRNPS